MTKQNLPNQEEKEQLKKEIQRHQLEIADISLLIKIKQQWLDAKVMEDAENEEVQAPQKEVQSTK